MFTALEYVSSHALVAITVLARRLYEPLKQTLGERILHPTKLWMPLHTEREPIPMCLLQSFN
jgi:hypothetical protein